MSPRTRPEAGEAALDATFRALADSTRRSMLRRLSNGPATIGELGSPFPITKQAVSRHVRVLEEAGLLERRIDGRIHRCSFDPRPLTRVERWVQMQRAAWSWSLDGLEEELARLQGQDGGKADNDPNKQEVRGGEG